MSEKNFWVQRGTVKKILQEYEDIMILEVEVRNQREKAINFPFFTGTLQPGDEVILNTTAVNLQLGTGGYHFVMGRAGGSERIVKGSGHIMKLRYTPWQFAVRSVEEQESPYHHLFLNFNGLEGLPVLVGELHSMLAPVMIILRELNPGARIVYIMPDAGALPLAISRLLKHLRNETGVTGTITCGHAFGGDLEAVNIYSALIAARKVFKADFAVVIMGPGIVGTGTRYGFSGLAQAEWLNASEKLGGIPILIPRISQAEGRKRHRGLSHHTRTVLEMTYCRANLAFNQYWLDPGEKPWRYSFFKRHRLWFFDWPAGFEELLLGHGDLLQSMGRCYKDDPLYFKAPALAALLATRFNRKKYKGLRTGDGSDSI